MTRRRAPSICIYCRAKTIPTKREHVISKALGTFENNWTLDCVCDECNHYFSRELELPLGRDSVEAFLRVDYGIKPPETAEKFLNTRMRFSVASEGLFQGARVEMQPGQEQMIPVPVPQVAFRKPGEDWKHVREKDLNKGTLQREASGDRVEVKILAATADIPRIRKRLEDLGFSFTETGYLRDQGFGEQGPISIAHDFVVDAVICRAAAKIVFNYAAYVLGCEEMNKKGFDQVRAFIRYGEEPRQIVWVTEQSILVGEEAKNAKCHACGIQWMTATGNLAGVLSLFNRITYGVLLAENLSEDWASVGFRHVFDPLSRKISSVP